MTTGAGMEDGRCETQLGVRDGLGGFRYKKTSEQSQQQDERVLVSPEQFLSIISELPSSLHGYTRRLRPHSGGVEAEIEANRLVRGASSYRT